MKCYLTTEDEKGIGFINVIRGNTVYAKIPFSSEHYNIIGDFRKDEAEKFAAIVLEIVENITP